MVDSRIQTKNIYVEDDYQNIILIDPNKIVLPDGKVQERLVDHEDLVYYANLQARVLPRTKLAVGADLDNIVENTSVATLKGNEPNVIDFLNPKNKTALDTSWSDQLTGKGSREGAGINQVRELKSEQTGRFTRNIIGQEDVQTLGIKQIVIKLNQAYIPQVTIELVDIQGRTLFEQGEKSAYAAFFNLPYPIFFLTIKGYYGKAIKYELMLKSFNASFDPGTGNYNITTEFIGRTAAILSDITISELFAVPHMYNKIITIEGNRAGSTEQEVAATSTNGIPTNPYERINTTKGFQTLNAVYSDYKSKGLIPKDFPHLSVNSLVLKLQQLDKFINESFGQQDLSVLNDIDDYEVTLTTYRDNVFGNFEGNWYTKYIDPTNVLIIGNKIYYGLKKTLQSDQNEETAKADLLKIITEYNEKLTNNQTFGDGQGYTINGKTFNAEIPVNINLDMIVQKVDINLMTPQDFEQTFIIQKNRIPSESELELFTQELQLTIGIQQQVLNNQTLEIEEDPKYYYTFGDSMANGSAPNGTFLTTLDAIQRKFKSQSQQIEEQLSVALAEKIKSSETGLGFNPTIRNVMAVLLASADAFLRLMDDVHKNAWDKRDDPQRLSVVLDSQKNFGVDNKDVVQSRTVNGRLNDNNVVYPWPQYFEEDKQENGNVYFTVKYPGDPSVINRTKGYLWDLWPEIEFTEEFLTATQQKQQIPQPTDYNNEIEFTKYIGVNAIEFPNKLQPFLNLSEVAFFYEIYERAYLGSFYTKLYKDSGYANELYSALGDFEYQNIKEAVEESPQLQSVLKRFSFNYNNFIDFLRNISLGGQGQNWNLFVRDEFVTPYIKEYVTQDFEIYSVDELNENSPSVQGQEAAIKKIVDYLASSNSSTLTLIDTAPFTNLNWIKSNLANGNTISTPESANNTTKSLTFYQDKKTISNITDNLYYNKFWTHIDWITNNGQNVSNNILNLSSFLQSNGQAYPTQTLASLTTHQELKSFYNNRTQKDFYPTESTLNYGTEYTSVSGNVTSIQTTSLFNTPYFVNSISKGVAEHKSGNTQTPYVALGYLALNSLPLITTREKLKDVNLTNKTVTDLDYLYASFTKFAAIHRLPYAWVLKYGSIWHRYKTYIETNTDILDGVWDDFDYASNYDPIGDSLTKQYTFFNYTGGTTTVELQSTYVTPGPIVTTYNNLNLGFYPQVINDFYYYFAQKDLLTGYTISDWNQAYNDSLRIAKTNQSTVVFPQGFDQTNPTRSATMVNWYQFYDTTSDNSLLYNFKQGYLLFPSTGALNFNQSKFEVTNTNGILQKEILNNDSIYNGSVRGLWVAPQFGYYDNSIIERPTPLQYLKVVYSGISQQEAFSLQSESVYSSIEEITSIFSKDILDYFERIFLNYCKPVGQSTDSDVDAIFNVGNLSKEEFFAPMNVTDSLYYSNINSLMTNFFIVSKSQLSGQENKDGNILGTQQMASISSYLLGFLNFDVILKLGNPSNYNRKSFGSFTPLVSQQPVDKFDFGNYTKGTLPNDGSGVTLTQSRSQFPGPWNLLLETVGFSTITGLEYSSNGSYYTDFFNDFNVAFTESNINLLSQVIKMYGSAKVLDNSLTPTQFKTQFGDFITLQEKFQFNAMNHTFIQLNKNLPNITETRVNRKISSVDGDVAKVELWETFKNLNDKWIAGGDFQTKTLFEDFLFLDRANRDIGDKIIVDVISLLGYLQSQTATFSLYSLIGELLGKNNFIFMALPAYINFYGIQNPQRTNGKTLDPEVANSAFGTFLSVDYQKSRPKFLCMYVGKPSEHLDLKENQSVRYQTDTFDLRRGVANPLLENQQDKTDWAYSNKVVGFNLDFGIRNQNMFQSISLNQNQYKNTAESFQQLVNLGNQASGDKVAQQSQSLYNVYRTRSYTCDVVSMGNVMIQPTMYFNLRHVPMFTGPYLITNVSHNINENGFNTQFSGVRVPIYSFPYIDKLVMSLNKDLLKRYREQVKQKASVSASSPNASNTSNSGTTASNNTSALGLNDACKEKTKYELLDFVDKQTTNTSRRDLKNYLDTIQVLNDNPVFKSYVYGVASLTSAVNSNQVIQATNNNLFGVTTDILWAGSVSTFLDGQVCVQAQDGKTITMGAFDGFTNSVDFFVAFNKNLIGVLDKLVSLNVNVNTTVSQSKALTQLYYSTWYNDYGYAKTAQQIIELVNNDIGKSISQTEFDDVQNAFSNALLYTN